jgi:hypothetical protein
MLWPSPKGKDFKEQCKDGAFKDNQLLMGTQRHIELLGQQEDVRIQGKYSKGKKWQEEEGSKCNRT